MKKTISLLILCIILAGCSQSTKQEGIIKVVILECLVELTEKSVQNNGAPVEIPDFTRGAWDKVKGLKFAE